MPTKKTKRKPAKTLPGSSYATWREAQNASALKRLRRALPGIFPVMALEHALRRRFTPPTPRRAIESYWRDHPIRADRLARALAKRSGPPVGWTWRVAQASPIAGERRASDPEAGLAATFRAPPAPYREAPFKRGPGHCCVCGQKVYRFGWHADLWGDGGPNRNATWHAACVVAWEFWNSPRAHLRVLRKLQGPKCPLTGKRLLRAGEVDHRTPLYRVWREHREKPWPQLLGFWGTPNLQVVNRDAHAAKCAQEALERTSLRRAKRDAERTVSLTA